MEWHLIWKENQLERCGKVRSNGGAIERYMNAWNLTPDDEPFFTTNGSLLGVKWDGQPALLKVSQNEEDRRGGGVLAAWNSVGAAKVFRSDCNAILMERAVGTAS